MVELPNRAEIIKAAIYRLNQEYSRRYLLLTSEDLRKSYDFGGVTGTSYYYTPGSRTAYVTTSGTNGILYGNNTSTSR